MHSVRKSANMTSITGRKPASDRPIDAPVMPASLIGVEITRPGKSVDKPGVTLNAPP